jgi:hypothetical protein
MTPQVANDDAVASTVWLGRSCAVASSVRRWVHCSASTCTGSDVLWRGWLSTNMETQSATARLESSWTCAWTTRQRLITLKHSSVSSFTIAGFYEYLDASETRWVLA